MSGQIDTAADFAAAVVQFFAEYAAAMTDHPGIPVDAPTQALLDAGVLDVDEAAAEGDRTIRIVTPSDYAAACATMLAVVAAAARLGLFDTPLAHLGPEREERLESEATMTLMAHGLGHADVHAVFGLGPHDGCAAAERSIRELVARGVAAAPDEIRPWVDTLTSAWVEAARVGAPTRFDLVPWPQRPPAIFAATLATLVRHVPHQPPPE